MKRPAGLGKWAATPRQSERGPNVFACVVNERTAAAQYAKELETRSERTIEALRQPGVDFQSRIENALRILRREET